MNRVLRAWAIAAGAAAVVASVLTGGLNASGDQVEETFRSPVTLFTARQATAGKGAFAKHCASCHQSDLSGDTEIPALAGKAFIAMWGSRSTKALFDYMSAAMPYGRAPLSEEAYTSILAYILQSNGAVAGESELSASTAAQIGSLMPRQDAPK